MINTSTVGEAPGYIQTLISVIKSNLIDSVECGLNGITDSWYITYEGDPSNDIRFGVGESEDASIKAFENITYIHKLYHYQEGKPIATENWNGQRVSVYYNQEGVREEEPFYGLTYDLEHGSVIKYPTGPVTLLQLNELVQALNTLANKSTRGVELLHMELGTPPLERLGYKRYPDLDKDSNEDEDSESLFT